MAKVEMTVDSVGVALIDYQRAIILKGKNEERYLPIWVGAYEADAIETGLRKMNACSSGPLVHEFVCSVIGKLGATLKYVVVDRFMQDTFLAKIFLERAGETLKIDCRPSDAFATAIRAGAPIYITEKILKEVGLTLSELYKITRSKKEWLQRTPKP